MFSRRPSKHSDVQHDDVLPFYVDLPKHNSDVGERMVIADAHQSLLSGETPIVSVHAS